MVSKIHSLIHQYCSLSLAVSDIRVITVDPGTKVGGITTHPNTCGFAIPVQGKAKFTISGQEFILERGKIVHAGGGMSLEKEVLGDEPWQFILLHYHCNQDSCSRFALMQEVYEVELTGGQYLQVVEIAWELWERFQQGGDLLPLKSKTLLMQLIEKIFQFSDREPPVCSVRRYIDRHLDSKLNIEELSRLFEIDARSLGYAFKREFGLSPKQYIRESRLNLAKELIRGGGYRISEVSRRVGYEDALYFSRTFKKHIGVAPSEFR